MNQALDLTGILASQTSCNLCGSCSQDFVFQKEGYDLVRCKNCGLLYLRNPPNEDQRQHLYSFQSGYHAQLEERSSAISEHREDAVANLRTIAKHARPGRILDVGCSTGLFLSVARSNGWTVKGLEYSPDSARIAREKNNLPVDQGELRSDAYPAASFDVITMWDVIEHVPDPRQTIAVARECLTREGLLVLKTPNADGLFPRASLSVAHQLNFWPHPEPPGHLYQFTAATLSRLLEEERFEVLAIYHRRIAIKYSFGNLRGWFRSPKWLAYCCAFAPIAMLGPYLGQGDDITVVARRQDSGDGQRPPRETVGGARARATNPPSMTG